MDLLFFVESFVLGVGLAMDAFSVSLANGLHEPCMKKRKMFSVAGTFAFFQALMPMIGWICVHTIAELFTAFESWIPWIALVLLLFIGGKMLLDGIRDKGETECVKVGFWGLIVQGIATSIDALSVGFTIAKYVFFTAFVRVLIVGVTTFALCLVGIYLGKKFGAKLSGKATIFGGIILILIGVEIFITGII